LLSARSERSRQLARNDWSSSLRPDPTPWFGYWPESSVLVSRRLICWSMRCCHGHCDRRAVARYAGLTGAPDDSGAQRREQGLARAGNARVRRGMIQLAWRFLMFQKESALAVWYRARTADSRRGTRKTMIVALARKLVICALALCHHRRTTGGRRLTSSVLKGLAGTSIPLSTIRRALAFQHNCRIDDPRWREAVFEHGT